MEQVDQDYSSLPKDRAGKSLGDAKSEVLRSGQGISRHAEFGLGPPERSSIRHAGQAGWALGGSAMSGSGLLP